MKVSDIYTFTKKDVYNFEPKEDITAFELAQIVKNVHVAPYGGGMSEIHFKSGEFEALPESIKRHFRAA